MKFSLHIKAALAVLSLTFYFNSFGALTKEFYAPESVLASGFWVKVGVDKSGLYEISYSRLREMGFANPEKVAVFGRGGKMSDLNFVNSSGVPLVDNDLKEVPVCHFDNKLIFYGVGPENFNFQKVGGYSLPVYYKNNGINIYSRRGYYFLTETESPKQIPLADEAENPKNVESGVGLVWHELDREQNTSRTGQFFWGESMLGNNNYHEWDVMLDNAVIGQNATVNLECYVPSGSVGNIKYGFTDSKVDVTSYMRGNTVFYYTPVTPTAGNSTVNTMTPKFYVSYNPSDDYDFANIDFWSITYPKTIPTLVRPDGSAAGQENISFYNLSDLNVEFTIPGGFSFKAMDITDPTNPRMIPVKPYGKNGKASFKASCDLSSVVVFDPVRPLMHVSGYENNFSIVANQNLHALAEDGAELLIITVPDFRQHAEKLASIHREHDGINVIVATVEEIYNEFSSGMPDPMAYRSFARLLYESPAHKLQNILLFGPLNNDIRGLVVEKDPNSIIIAYQSPQINVEKGAMNANDYYGMMNDRITSSLELAEMQVGVGVLPCTFPGDADIIVKKIEDFLYNADPVYTLNEMLNIGGLGDDHTYDFQAIDIGDYVNYGNSSHMVVSTLSIDAYGNAQARKKMLEYFNAGKGIVTYFGHGAPSMLGKDKNFFSGDNIRELKNTRLPFMLFAGCVLTNFDRGQRGIAESMVLSTPHGLIGSLAATRDTWSDQNLDFMKTFLNRMYRDGDNVNATRLENTLTVGQVYAKAKTQSNNSNELAYHLICDPALRIPVANRKISFDSSSLDAAPGSEINVKGAVCAVDNSTDTGFNGKVLLKVMQPVTTLRSDDIETFGSNTNTLDIEYGDYLVTEQLAKVVNGRFSTKLYIPANMSEFSGKECYAIVSAFDYDRRIGAGGRKRLKITSPSSSDPVIEDKNPPVVESFVYDEDSRTLRITVADDMALDLSQSPFSNGFFFSIDGKSYAPGSFATKTLDSERPAYSKEISVGHLHDGTHTAKAVVKDAAGNSSVMEISFTINSIPTVFSLSTDNAPVDDTCAFNIAGNPENPMLVIMDINGNLVYEKNFSGSSVSWNRKNNSGADVAPGLYKAFIIETGAKSNKAHSNTVQIPVI